MKVQDIVQSSKLEARRANWKAKGTVHGTKVLKRPLPPSGKIFRYICTSAQNNTKVHDKTWVSLTALAKHYQATILIGTFSYDQNKFDAMAVKRGKAKGREHDVWFDERILPYLCDERQELANGLVWCGEMNILPTMVNPLAGLESYSDRKSGIFPHAKLAMRSIPTMMGEGTKLNFTTGTVTKRNYVAKRMGLIAEFHHVYGGLLVEVDSSGHWWVRQLNADREGRIQDLEVLADGGKVTTGNKVEAVTWGDLHATLADPTVVAASVKMLDCLKPKYQFLHDVMEGASTNRHVIAGGATNFPHYGFWRWKRGLHKVDEELRRTVEVIQRYVRPWSKIVVPESNHDAAWLYSWLGHYDYKVDPANAELFLDLQRFMYSQITSETMPRDVELMQYVFEKFGLKGADFLRPDESFKICGDKIECGMHGHLGPNGARGTPENLSKMGRKANIAHTHAAGIYNGLYVAGTSSQLKWSYNLGPSSWSHSHVVTYPNGKRTIVTVYAGKWRAE